MGEDIGAAQVGQAISHHPAVAETAVAGVCPADAAGEDDVMAYAAPAGESPPDWEALILHCSSRLAEFRGSRFWKRNP